MIEKMAATSYECARCGSLYVERSSFCSTCGGFNTVIPQATRPADNLWSGSQSMTAAELIRSKRQHLISKAYPDIIIGRQSLVAITGPPGSGKTTMMMKWLDSFDVPVLFLSIEEGLGDTMVNKLQWLEIHSEKFRIATIRSIDEIEPLLSGVSVLGLDSLSASSLGVDDLARIVIDFQIPFIFTLHVTKGLQPSGPMENLHRADVIIFCKNRQWAIQKSRFSGLKGGSV